MVCIAAAASAAAGAQMMVTFVLPVDHECCRLLTPPGCAVSPCANLSVSSRASLTPMQCPSMLPAAPEVQVSTPSQTSSGTSHLRSPGSGSVELQPWKVAWRDLTIKHPIGEGSFGKLRRKNWRGGRFRVAALSCIQLVPRRPMLRNLCPALCPIHAPPSPVLMMRSTCRPSLQVYLADWFSIQVAAKVLIVGQLGSPADAQRALTLSAPIMAKLEQEASLLASLRWDAGAARWAQRWRQRLWVGSKSAKEGGRVYGRHTCLPARPAALPRLQPAHRVSITPCTAASAALPLASVSQAPACGELPGHLPRAAHDRH